MTTNTRPLASLVAELRAEADARQDDEGLGYIWAADRLQTVLDAMCDAVAVIQCARFENFELKDFCGAHQVFDSQGTERWGKFTKHEATK